MKTRRLPGTDLDLSVVGFGAWAIGGVHWGDDVDDARSTAAVHTALDVGITWFDTAPIYGWAMWVRPCVSSSNTTRAASSSPICAASNGGCGHGVLCSCSTNSAAPSTRSNMNG